MRLVVFQPEERPPVGGDAEIVARHRARGGLLDFPDALGPGAALDAELAVAVETNVDAVHLDTVSSEPPHYCTHKRLRAVLERDGVLGLDEHLQEGVTVDADGARPGALLPERCGQRVGGGREVRAHHRLVAWEVHVAVGLEEDAGAEVELVPADEVLHVERAHLRGDDKLLQDLLVVLKHG